MPTETTSPVLQALDAACACCEDSRVRSYLEKDGYFLRECLGCGLIFVSQAHKLSVESIYSSSRYFQSEDALGVDFLEAAPQLRSVAGERVRKISRRWGKPPGLLLEVGCAVGYLLEAAQQAGWKTKGVELSEFAADLARSNGLDVVTGSLEDARNQLQPGFDVVAMYHVIEHLTDPLETLRQIRSLAGVGALLVVETPDISSRRARREREKWKYCIPPEHLFYFSPKSLTHVLARAGFEVVALETNTLTEMLQFTKKYEMDGVRDFVKNHLGYFLWIRKAYKLVRTLLGADDVIVAYARAIPGAS